MSALIPMDTALMPPLPAEPNGGTPNMKSREAAPTTIHRSTELADTRSTLATDRVLRNDMGRVPLINLRWLTE